MKPFRSSLIALAILGLFFALFFFIKPPEQRQMERDAVELQIIKASPQDLSLLRIERGPFRLTLTRTIGPSEESPYGVWTISEPAVLPVDPGTLKNILESYGNLRAQRRLPLSNDDLKKYGLDAPWMTLQLETTQKTGGTMATDPILLEIGAVSRIGGQTYFSRLQGQPFVYLLAQEQVAMLAGDVKEFRDHRVWRFDRKAVAGLTIQQSGATWTADRSTSSEEASAWTLRQGTASIAADPARMSALLSTLETLTIEQFAADHFTAADLIRFDLKSPDMTISIRLADGTSQRLIASKRISSDSGQKQINYVLTEGTRFIYAVDNAVFERLKRMQNFAAEPPSLEKEGA